MTEKVKLSQKIAKYPLDAFPALNWKEIALLVKNLNSEIKGLHVRKVSVPARAEFPNGFLKSEWAMQLGSRDADVYFFFSVRPQRPYFISCKNRRVKQAAQGTRSGFDLALDKYFYGTKIKSVEAFPQERWIAVWMEGDLGLVLKMIPAQPEAYLVQKVAGQLQILARSKQNTSNDLDAMPVLEVSDGSQAPLDLEVRHELTESLAKYSNTIEKWLSQEALSMRYLRAQRILTESLKIVKMRLRQSEVALAEAQQEPPWDYYGHLMKSSLHLNEGDARDRSIKQKFLMLLDYKKFNPETGEPAQVKVPCDPKLSFNAQTEKFFSMARRKERRFSESRSRIESFQGQILKLSKTELLLSTPPLSSEKMLEIEEKLGLSSSEGGTKTTQDKSRSRIALAGWSGRIFTSRDGFPIWVGRVKDENLELTFKLAKGNDMWMHVRGRPGAHTVIPVTAGKSIPLETLLDAAVLTVFYSGGEKWGKTEVDYTFKKYVKRIKDSTEASYTHNKTLIVEPQGERLQRLLAVLNT